MIKFSYYLKKTITIIEKFITFFEEWTIFLTVFTAMVALLINIILRYAFNSNLSWSEEFVREVIIYTTFIGCSCAIKRGAEIKIDATFYIFPFFRKGLTFISRIATFIFSIILIYYGFHMANLMYTTNQKTIILKIPLVFLYSILPLSGLLMLFRILYVFFEPWLIEDKNVSK